MASFLNKIRSWLCGLICVCSCKCNCPAKTAPVVPPALSQDFFDAALEYVFPNEGNYSNHPSDKGGPTRWGITKQTLSSWLKRDVTVAEVQQLPYSTAVEIYKTWYWGDVGFDKITNKALAICLFDTGILVGPRTAINYAQIAANNCGSGLQVDGYCGPETCLALSKVHKNKFLNCYRDLLKERFDGIVAGDTSQLVFYTGWMNRANRLLTLAGL